MSFYYSFNEKLFLNESDSIIERTIKQRGYKGIPDFRAIISHFVDCVMYDKEPLINARDGARTVTACAAAIESANLRKAVAVETIPESELNVTPQTNKD